MLADTLEKEGLMQNDRYLNRNNQVRLSPLQAVIMTPNIQPEVMQIMVNKVGRKEICHAFNLLPKQKRLETIEQADPKIWEILGNLQDTRLI